MRTWSIFVTPSEVRAFTSEQSQKKVRVAGMVVKGSVKTRADPVGLTFELTDGEATIPVVFQGIPPDLFKKDKARLLEGHWKDGRFFHSKMIMAKHSEDYMPIEMKRAGVELPKKVFMKTLSP